jgi:hypothetical protein
MRSIVAFLIALLLAPLAHGQDEEWIKLRDGEHAREIKKGLKIAEEYFEDDAKVAKGGRTGARAVSDRDKALREFQEWLAETKETIGRDLREEVFMVMALLDEARVKVVDDTKGYRKGQISYFKVPDPKGMERLEYSIIVPKKYDPEEHRYPLVISLHGRVIDSKHPAFRGEDFSERSRQVLYNYWRKSPAAENILVMAPTGNPGGFKFDEKRHYLDLQVMYRSMVEMMTKYRVDWDRVFLEVQGSALRVACEQAFMFAGIIVRDRIEDRREPFIPPEQFFMFENLNGTPLLYIADADNWDKVGKPTAEALEAAYTKAGVPQNLVILKDKRDANGALKGDPEAIAKFVQTHRRNNRRTSFTWRFFNDGMISPTPLGITTANYTYDLDPASRAAPLEKKAGSVKFEITKETDGDQPYTKINVEITEAEGVRIHLHDGIVDLNQPVTLVVNGKVIHDKVTVKRDWTIFWDRVLPGRFFMLPFVGVIDGQFPHKPQFESPEDKKEEAAAGADGAGAEKEGASEDGDAGKGEDAGGGAAASDDGGAEKKATAKQK